MARQTKGERDVISRYEKFVRGSELCTQIHRDYREDKKFVELDLQWDAAALAQRNAEITPRPSLVINLCRQFSYQVVNEAAQKRVAGKIIPCGEGATQKTAEVYEGLIRAIQRTSNAEAAYNHALRDAVNGGFGAFRIIPEYESDSSFDQCLKIKRIMDATSVRWDVNSTEPDFSDMMECSFSQQMTKKAFEDEYGKEAMRYYTTSSTTPDPQAWGDKEGPVVTEYWYIEETSERLYRLTELDENGIPKSAWESELVSNGGEVPDELVEREVVGADAFGDIFEAVSRMSKRRKVKWCKLAGGRVLREVDWPGYWIPIFIIPGREVVVDGMHRFVSMIRPMKDSQRVYNYARSNQVEKLSLAPKNPYLVAEESISPQQKKFWDSANTKNYSALKYRAYDDKGRQLPKPERTQPVSTDPALTEETILTGNELKQVTGKYDPTLGKNKGDQSGKAILALQDQGDTATFDFIDNRNTAIEHAMQVLIDLIPYYYDTRRQVMIINAEEKQELVVINSPATDKDGQPYTHDLTMGKYKLAVEVGPDRKTRMQQNADTMMGIAQAVPQAPAARPDLMFKLLSMANGFDRQISGEMEDSLKAMLPPPIQEQIKQSGGQQQIPPQVLQALAQADQEHAAMEQQIAQLTDARQMEERKLAIEEYKAETGRIDMLIAAGMDWQKAILQANLSMDKEQMKAEFGMLQSMQRPSPQGDAPAKGKRTPAPSRGA